MDEFLTDLQWVCGSPVVLGVFGLLVGSRGFFPGHLARSGREQMIAVLEAAGYEVICPTPEETTHGAVQSREDAKKGAELYRKNADRISGVKARRPGLDQLMLDARRGSFDVLLVWACDRIARSTRHLLEVLDELNHLGIEFVSFRENIDTGGPLGRAITIIIGAIAELERSLIVERVRSGMRRARLEGRHIGRPALSLDRDAILRDRRHGDSLGTIARNHSISRTTVHRVLTQHGPTTQPSPYL